VVARLNRPTGLPQISTQRVDQPVIQRAVDAITRTLIAVVNFLQPFAQPQPWREVEFVTGWLTFSDKTQYRKDPLGRVHIQGNAYRASGSSTTIFVLPEGCRPGQDLYFPGVTLTGAAYTVGRIDVREDGRVLVASGGYDFAILDGISFYAADA
jgi:hypothetical protein